jgi:hypothetical protein
LRLLFQHRYLMDFGYLPQSDLETGNLRTDDQLQDAIRTLQVSAVFGFCFFVRDAGKYELCTLFYKRDTYCLCCFNSIRVLKWTEHIACVVDKKCLQSVV